MKSPKFILICSFLILTLNALAQQETHTMGVDDFFGSLPVVPMAAKATISQDRGIDKLINRHIKLSQIPVSQAGWRVQIYLGSGRDAEKKAEDTKKAFLEKYPDYGAYVTYQAPFFKVKVGDFRRNDKARAYKFKKQLESDFQTTWVVEDQIK